MSASTLRLYSDRGCPFAHRVLASLQHVAVPFTHHEASLGAKPEGLAGYSASGRVPLLVHGELVLTESRVMLEYLAERFGFAGALPADVASRALHRHAMAVVDDFLAPRLFGPPLADTQRARLEDTLRALEVATAGSEPAPSLLAFHVAPIWLRLRWWVPASPVTRAIEARPSLCTWLDAALALDAVASTAPDPAEDAAELERARAAGLVPRPPEDIPTTLQRVAG